LPFSLLSFDDNDDASSISFRSTSGSVTALKLVLVGIEPPERLFRVLCSGPLTVVEVKKSTEKALMFAGNERQNAAAVTVAIACFLLLLLAVDEVAFNTGIVFLPYCFSSVAEVEVGMLRK
jgi:hypothetical protein